jgi:hypothetical protein
MIFYPGLHLPSDAKHFRRAFLSVNTLRRRKTSIDCGEWIMDSGAFTEISTYGFYRETPQEYANEITRLLGLDDGLKAVVSQDWMCEPFILRKTGLTVEDHQRLTIERYDELHDLIRDVYLMPVLQGYCAYDYLAHLDGYGDRLTDGMWVGVGSVCKRNTNIYVIELILTAIRTERPDLRLHGFGLKTTALQSSRISGWLWSADSMAWSYAARKQGRNQNDWREAMGFTRMIEGKTSATSQEAAFEEVELEEIRRYLGPEWKRPEPFRSGTFVRRL